MREIPLSSEDKVQITISEHGDFTIARPSKGQKLDLPPKALREVLVNALEIAKLESPPKHWTTAEAHYDDWNGHRRIRLTKEFNDFLEVFIYLISLEHNRTENAIWWKLKTLGIIENKGP